MNDFNMWVSRCVNGDSSGISVGGCNEQKHLISKPPGLNRATIIVTCKVVVVGWMVGHSRKLNPWEVEKTH